MRQHHYIILLLIIVCLAVFWELCGYEFLNYDDNINVCQNPYLKNFTLHNILRFWKEPYRGLYIPLTYNFWALQVQLAKLFPVDSSGTRLNPHVFHTTNLTIHLLSMVVVFFILRLLIRNDWAACAGALLFAIHPVQAEPVAWVTGLKDVLSGLLSLAAVWQYICYAVMTSDSITGAEMGMDSRLRGNDKERSSIFEPLRRCFSVMCLGGHAALGAPCTDLKSETPNSQHYFDTTHNRECPNDRRRRIHYIVATTFFVLAMMAKPTAVVVPLVVLILSCWILNRPFRQVFVELVPWVVLALPVIVWTKFMQPDAHIEFIPAFWQRPLIAGDALTFYLYKLVLPISLGPDYGRSPEFVLEHGWVYLTGVIPYILLIVLIWKSHRRWLLASAGIFVAGVLPVLGFVPFTFQGFSTVADRYLYFSMLGPALGIAWFLSNRRGMTVKVICIAVLCILSLLSAYQLEFWKDSYIFFKHALIVNSKSQLAHVNLANVLKQIGRLDEAVFHCAEAIKLNPNDMNAHNNMGLVLQIQGKLDEAIFHYNESLRICPDFAEAHNNIGIVLQKQGKLEEAKFHCTEAFRLNPNYFEAHYNLANILQGQGKLKEAIFHYTEALRLNPNCVSAHNNLGNVLKGQGKLDEAIFHYTEVLRINPGHKKARYNLMRALEQKKRQKPQ